MVQYYREMWAKHSEMLAPLSDLVGECGKTKTPGKNKAKKKPWHWDSIHQIAFDDVKSTIFKEVVLAYTDFTKPFDIYANPRMRTISLCLMHPPYVNFSVLLPIRKRGLPPYAYGDQFLMWL